MAMKSTSATSLRWPKGHARADMPSAWPMAKAGPCSPARQMQIGSWPNASGCAPGAPSAKGTSRRLMSSKGGSARTTFVEDVMLRTAMRKTHTMAATGQPGCNWRRAGYVKREPVQWPMTSEARSSSSGRRKRRHRITSTRRVGRAIKVQPNAAVNRVKVLTPRTIVTKWACQGQAALRRRGLRTFARECEGDRTPGKRTKAKAVEKPNIWHQRPGRSIGDQPRSRLTSPNPRRHERPPNGVGTEEGVGATGDLTTSVCEEGLMLQPKEQTPVVATVGAARLG